MHFNSLDFFSPLYFQNIYFKEDVLRSEYIQNIPIGLKYKPQL